MTTNQNPASTLTNEQQKQLAQTLSVVVAAALSVWTELGAVAIGTTEMRRMLLDAAYQLNEQQDS